MLKQQQPGSGGRKTSNGILAQANMSSTASGINSRTVTGRNRHSAKTSQPSTMFEGVYNNARMLHYLTAVVGSTCDVRVKNGSVYEGIFKTLSSRCELAVDAVHRRCETADSPSAPPRREEITDTMIFNPSDIVTMTCRDVDLSYATRDSFTDTAISSSRVNGEHKEKVLQKWDGGDSNGENYDLDTDASNGWDANEMFKFNEENYGIKSTYDSSLSLYTVPLERGSSEGFRQREARAARLASEIESSPQYRFRVSLENDDGRSEEERFSSVIRDRDGADRERGRESPRERERERGRDSPSCGNREGKYIPLPQRARDIGSGSGMRGERGERGGGGGGTASLQNRIGGYHSNRPTPSNTSPRPPLPTSGGQSASSSERSSPLSNRGGYSPHHPQSSPNSTTAYTPPPSLSSSSSSGNFGGSLSRLIEQPAGTTAPLTGSPTSPPTAHSQPISHSIAHPHTLSDAARPVNGVSSRTSPKSQRPVPTNKPLRNSTTHPALAVSRSPKSGSSSQDTPLTASQCQDTMSQKPPGPTPTFTVDVNEVLGSTNKERMAENLVSPQETKSPKASSQQLQYEELRKFGTDFRLQHSEGSSKNVSPSVAQCVETSLSSPAQSAPVEPSTASEPKSSATQSAVQPAASPSPSEERAAREKELEGAASSNVAPAAPAPAPDRQSPVAPQPARTPGSEDIKLEAAERVEGVADQVKKSTLNPNAKEFNPNKPTLTLSKPASAPTPPRPTPPSPSVVLQHPPAQGAIYNSTYAYMPQIHPTQMYQYTMSAVSQGKYPRAKGSVVAHRSDHSPSAPPMLQAAATAAGPPLVASPYPQSYLQYNPQQYSQQVIQPMTHYPGQPMYSVLQAGARMLGSAGGHPQALGPPGGPQFPGQAEGPPGPQQGLYAPQTFSHHSGSMHPPQPSSTPTGSQPPPQHTAPSPGQSAQSGPQTQSLYHSGQLSAATPPNMPPGHTSPQGSYPMPGFNLHGHQSIAHTYPSLGQLAQPHVPGALSGPPHTGAHAPPPMMLLHAPPPQQGPGTGPQHPQHGPPPQQGPHQHYTYTISHPQVPTHPPQQLPFHPPGN